MIKRLLDVVLSAAGLLVLSPVMAAVAVAVRLDGPGPILYSQWRMGRNFRPFRIFKFRTMIPGADRLGGGLTVHADPRITRVGGLLRESKLDELPQLFNVLRGDMSLVGPRPELPRYVQLFQEDFAEVLKARPGVTDPASITYRNESELLSASGDPEERYLHFILPDKLRMARQYVAHHSAWLDLLLVLETLVVLAYPARAVERLVGRLGSRHRVVSTAVQAALLAVASLAAAWLRYGGTPPPPVAGLVLAGLPVVVAVRCFWLDRTRLCHDVWHFFGPREGLGIAAAAAFGTATLWALATLPTPFASYPRSVLILDGLIGIVLLSGARVARCVHRRLSCKTLAKRRVLVVGGDDAAERIVHGLAVDPQHDYVVVGLVAPQACQRGMSIHRVPILGGLDEVSAIIATHDPDEIIVSSSAIPVERRREVVAACRRSERPVRVVPDLGDLVSGRDRAYVVDPPGPEDLLFRKPIEVDLDEMRRTVAGRCVLVTGAGGSIGSEICRQVAALGPSSLVLFEKHEASLYDIERSLRQLAPDTPTDPVIGDVRDASRVARVFAVTRPDVVFHAAAYKHVPMMERNPLEAIKTNVLGTRTVAEAAERAGVGTFVLISTDKAVEPVSVMGATKRMAEIVLDSFAEAARTSFITVRFGNVLDSSGSVIPLFREQIERGGPVTVTHESVTRWFMTVPEAVRLILTAASIGRGGEVFVLDMGKPVRILDLARTLIRQYGLRPERDVPIVFTGLRPGERLYEKLFGDHEVVWKTAHPRILMAVDGAADDAGRRQRREEFWSLVQMIEAAGGRWSPDLRAELPDLERACA